VESCLQPSGYNTRVIIDKLVDLSQMLVRSVVKEGFLLIVALPTHRVHDNVIPCRDEY
jgi:hypothetical protein